MTGPAPSPARPPPAGPRGDARPTPNAHPVGQCGARAGDPSGWLLAQLADRVLGVTHAALVSADGLVLTACPGLAPEHSEALAEATSVLLSQRRGITDLVGCGALSQILVEMTDATLVMLTIRGGVWLSVLADTACDIGLLRQEMALLGERLGRSPTPVETTAPIARLTPRPSTIAPSLPPVISSPTREHDQTARLDQLLSSRPAAPAPAVAPAHRRAGLNRPRLRWSLLGASVAAAATVAAAAFVASTPSGAITATPNPAATIAAKTASENPAGAAPVLTLTTPAVKIGDSYVATASGFTPGEPIQLSWTGPTNGMMGAAPADSTGARQHGPVLERDPPGHYDIIATGLRSGRTARAQLQVLPGTPQR
ncbi:MAG: roadblock/LC7 domain-containing protein [Actinomycetota bacterium]|nr:roadblock/LC7 domain-containing protein [Actinomycetota bacterium]